jgi:hypothetical protein
MHARAAQLHPHGVRQPLDRVFRRDIGRAPPQRRVTHDRGMHHDPAVSLRDHHRDRQPRQLVHAEDVRGEDMFQRLARHILGRAGHAVPAIVEQRVDAPARDLQRGPPPGLDAGRIAMVDPHAVEPLGAPRGHILVLAAGGDHVPAAPAQRVRGREADAGGTSGDENAARHTGFPVLRLLTTASSRAQGNPRTCIPSDPFRGRGDAPSHRRQARSALPPCPA